VATSFICKHDNTGKWEPNYSNVAGNIISVKSPISIIRIPRNPTSRRHSNPDYRDPRRHVRRTLQEFWPDISRKLFHKDPTNGLDAKARAVDDAAKKAKQTQPSTQSGNRPLNNRQMRQDNV